MVCILPSYWKQIRYIIYHKYGLVNNHWFLNQKTSQYAWFHEIVFVCDVTVCVSTPKVSNDYSSEMKLNQPSKQVL